MGRPTIDASSVSSTQVSEAAPLPPLPQYFIDFDVKITSSFLGKKVIFERRQFVLTGQKLQVCRDAKPTHSFSARDITIEHLSGYLYRLKGKPWQRLVLSSPSASRLERFRHVLDLAAKTRQWTPPKDDVMTRLVQVATEIVEAEAAAPSNPSPDKYYSSFPIPPDKGISTVTVAQVQAHLAEKFAMYQFQGKCTNMVQVYSHLVDLEAEYRADPTVNNFAHTVHRLHPVKYKTWCRRDTTHRVPLKEILSKCPFPQCGNTFAIEMMYKFHIKGESLHHNSGNTPPDGNVKTFMDELHARMREQAPNASHEGVKELQSKVRDKGQKHFNPHNFGSFELDLVLAMIRQLDFVNKTCAHMEYWNNPTVIQASIIRYHKFMHPHKTKAHDSLQVPTADIDLVWHTHMTDHDKKYDAFVRSQNCLIDHDDTLGTMSLDRGYSEVFYDWLSTYDDAERLNQAPSRDCRFYGVDEPFPIQALPYAAAVVPDKLAVDVSQKPFPNNLSVYLTVIGTPVTDGRVRLQYSRQSYIMG
ncbi:hypothetical protein AeRB84_011660 [Aphanomyces euteiches]|nr:hypothetical protein AeRB84_011660 [Aphanomyces euteiches]